MRSFGITSGLSWTFQLRPERWTMTSGTTMFASARANGRAGFGSSATIIACASRSSVSSAPVTAISFFRSRLASSGRWLLADDDRDRLRLRALARAQLQRQALGEVVRADPSRLHALQVAQRAAQLRDERLDRVAVAVVVEAEVGDEAAFDEARGDVLDRVGEVAVVVERIDEDEDGGGIRRREPHPGELAAQVVLESLRDRVAVAVVGVVEVVVGPRRPGSLADAVEVLVLGAVSPSRRRYPNSAAASIAVGSAASTPSPPGSAARSDSRSPARSATESGSASGSNAGAASSSTSRNGFCSSICSTSWCSSSVDSWSSRIDCCSCGVSARCCESRTWSVCFHGAATLPSGRCPQGARPGCGGPAPGRRAPRQALLHDASCADSHPEVLAEVDLADVGVGDDLGGVPSASTRPSLMM
jgi:hypothetical protein